MRRTVTILAVLALAAGLAACRRGPGEVTHKVLQDFGLEKRPDDYVPASDKIFGALGDVGKVELKRLNQLHREGEIKYQEDGLQGRYYKEQKVYEAFYPLDVKSVAKTGRGDRGYNGYIEYAYRIHQSPRKPTRTEALMESASIPTMDEGREIYRYHFTVGGTWDGSKGQKARR